MSNDRIGRTNKERYSEALGSTVLGADPVACGGNDILEDAAVAAFNERWSDDLRTSDVETLDRIIGGLPLVSQPVRIPKDEQLRRLAIIGLKLGMPDAAEAVRCLASTESDLEWDEVTLPL